MHGAWRAAAAALLCGGIAAAWAQELRLRQPDGKVLTVIDDQGAGGPLLQWIERRNPDGSFDLSFGRSGRASFSQGASILEPRSLGLDALGRVVLSGTARGGDGRSAAVVSRFLPDGSADSRWGTQGSSRVAPGNGSALAVDALPMPDHGMLLLGQIDAAGARSVVLWRLHLDGAADTTFGRAGVLHLAPLDGAQPTSLRQDDDGSVLIAAQRPQAGGLLLEVQRWRPPDEGLQWVARQMAPADWRGPATLERRDGRWHWRDAVTAGALPLAFVDEAVIPPAPAGQASANPFAPPSAEVSPAPIPAAEGGMTQALRWALLAMAAVLLALATRRWRAASAANARTARVPATLLDTSPRESAGASSAPADAPPRGSPGAAACPPSGPPDDLKRIKGIGPVLEARLHREGIFHFRQIAQWRPEDVDAIGARLSGFRGRIARDRWVVQAIELAR